MLNDNVQVHMYIIIMWYAIIRNVWCMYQQWLYLIPMSILGISCVTSLSWEINGYFILYEKEIKFAIQEV